ncbi:lysophospholipid acyltransferase family protein [Erythrobacter sp. W53]|uniref:lysophospholipid acyltransferase family protein n=1 Tax=Erythrobacter sp. W53 TaxID=3425947 RepID=UPI003D767949
MLLIRNLAFYLVFYAGSVVVTGACLLALPFSRDWFRRFVHMWSGMHRWAVIHLLGCELVIEGEPLEEPALYAIKHESFFEAIDTTQLLRVPAVFAKQELFSIWGWGHAGRAYGLVPVARDAGAKALMAMIREARAMVKDGRPLVIFPEGTRIPHGERPPLQAGFAGLYKMLGLQVVPVAIDAGPLYQRRLKRKGRITYRFGEPIPPGLPRAEVEERVLDAINALNT